MRFSHLIAAAVLLIGSRTGADDTPAKSSTAHDETNQPVAAEFAEYRTVDTAITTKTDRMIATRPTQPGYLGDFPSEPLRALRLRERLS
jgi:hypothetical protein